MRFIAQHADRCDGGLRWGVESICRVLTGHGCPVSVSGYYESRARPPSPRAVRDQLLAPQVARVHAETTASTGPAKVWLTLNREGIGVARCTVERLMKAAGLQGVRRGTRRRTTIGDPAAPPG